MRFPRAAGILLHPTSLPGPYGIGSIGKAAYAFVDFLEASGHTLWQVLPLGPTGYGDSPYACFSAFAGNPLLIDLDLLVEAGDLTAEELAQAPVFPADYVDFGPVITFKLALLHRAAQRFRAEATRERWRDFEDFCVSNSAWLEDFVLFMALKEAHGGAVWNTWERDLVARDPLELQAWRDRLADTLFAHRYFQYQFFRQWEALKRYANEKGIRIIGDIPIFVAFDSADVWAHPEYFALDENFRSTVVAGVPPDYFSATGQLWGNPLYRWDKLAENGYDWWLARVQQTLKTVDIIRLDHFRGFEAYWEIPAGEETAVNGRWVPGPGADFFTALENELGELPLIAEDLGFITPGVQELRDSFELPGMKILQFAFATDASNEYLPHNYPTPNCVVYTGTHDNDTTMGWFEKAPEEEREAALRYLGPTRESIAWALMRLAYQSIADLALVPLQDVLELGTEARMNLPGRASGNWSWRFKEGDLTEAHIKHLRELAETYGRKEPAEKKEKPHWM